MIPKLCNQLKPFGGQKNEVAKKIIPDVVVSIVVILLVLIVGFHIFGAGID